MPGLMGSSKWAPGAGNDDDDSSKRKPDPPKQPGGNHSQNGKKDNTTKPTFQIHLRRRRERAQPPQNDELKNNETKLTPPALGQNERLSNGINHGYGRLSTSQATGAPVLPSLCWYTQPVSQTPADDTRRPQGVITGVKQPTQAAPSAPSATPSYLPATSNAYAYVNPNFTSVNPPVTQTTLPTPTAPSITSPSFLTTPATYVNPNFAVQPSIPNAPVPKLKKSAVRIVGSANAPSPIATPSTTPSIPATSTRAGSFFDEPLIDVLPNTRSTQAVTTAQVPAPSPGPACVLLADMESVPSIELTLAISPTTLQVQGSTGVKFRIPSHASMSDAEYIFLILKLRRREVTACEWDDAVRQVQQMSFGTLVKKVEEQKGGGESVEEVTANTPGKTDGELQVEGGVQNKEDKMSAKKEELADAFSRLMREDGGGDVDDW